VIVKNVFNWEMIYPVKLIVVVVHEAAVTLLESFAVTNDPIALCTEIAPKQKYECVVKELVFANCLTGKKYMQVCVGLLGSGWLTHPSHQTEHANPRVSSTL
jgi:intracellular sulfur oxidation DsrE/DsrF family protein